MINRLFNEYKQLTKTIISGVKINVPVEEFFARRECIINEMKKIDIEGKAKEEIYIESGAKELDLELKNVLSEEIIKTKEEIKKANMGKQMFSSYVSNANTGNFFKRTI